MHIMIVHLHVKEDRIADFKALVLDNASHSIQEPGLARFDVLQQNDDPARFVLVEVYRQESDTEAHRASEHYARWRDAVGGMLVSERTRTFYSNVFPEDADWN